MARRGFAGTRVTSGAAARPHRERCHAHADAHAGRAARIASRATCRFVASVLAPGSGAPGSGPGYGSGRAVTLALHVGRRAPSFALRPPSASRHHRVIASSGHRVIRSSRRPDHRVVGSSRRRTRISRARIFASHSLTVSQSHSLTAWGPQRTGARGDASRPWRRARRRGSAAAGLAVRRPRTREVGESRIARGEISCTARAFVARLSRSRRKVTCPKRRASGAGSRFVAAWAGATRALISIYSAVIFIVRARRVGSPGDVK